jgi:hypothetical protein
VKPINHEQMREYTATWDAASHEERSEIASEWFETVPSVMRLLKQRRRAFRVDAPVYLVAPVDWHRLCERHRGCCAYCGKQAPLTMDHLVPLARGGHHSIGNIVPACDRCNSKKGEYLLTEWKWVVSNHKKFPLDRRPTPVQQSTTTISTPQQGAQSTCHTHPGVHLAPPSLPS